MVYFTESILITEKSVQYWFRIIVGSPLIMMLNIKVSTTQRKALDARAAFSEMQYFDKVIILTAKILYYSDRYFYCAVMASHGQNFGRECQNRWPPLKQRERLYPP